MKTNYKIPVLVTSVNGNEFVLREESSDDEIWFIYRLVDNYYFGHSGHHKSPKEAYMTFLEAEIQTTKLIIP